MNSKKQKPREMKRRFREEKKKQERIGLVVAVAILIVIISVSGFLIHSMFSSSPQKQETSSTSEPKAAIVDHLSLTMPNQTFIQTATNILKQAGYTVDYYPGENVTVEFYRNLPTHGYSLIVLRVHSALAVEFDNQLLLFTSEPYSTTRYFDEQWTYSVGRVCFTREGPYYFAISEKFVKSSMNSRFEDTTIIMMGCNGLTYNNTAEAFIEKGAKVYISWNEAVSAPHTDQATIQLLNHLLIQKQTIEQAVTETMKEVGPDPAYESLMMYYPLEVEDQTIRDFKNES